MDFEKTLAEFLSGTAEVGSERIRSEIRFASAFAEIFPNSKDEWRQLILRAIDAAKTDPHEAETILAPIGEQAKKYTIHCCGHAHIDMNWTWPLLETIATTHDTFATLDKLMDDYPELKFAQSQIPIYSTMKDYCPEIFQTIQKHISEKRWQVTAASWVEGDKNMASGESLCRHILYSKRWLKEHLGLPYDTVKIDWQPDTFGHPWTLPSILVRGGVHRYYRSRPPKGPWLSWWQSPDDSRVLVYHDKSGYNGPIDAKNLTIRFIDFASENNLKDFLWVYGMSDHGGGPTRRNILNAIELNSWPIFPNVKFSTVDQYFDIIEPDAGDLPVNNGDINTVFEGCYTSQSEVKRVNRLAETMLPEVEAISVLAGSIAGSEYNSEAIHEAWQHALFNQFHDILAGSSGHAAMEESAIRFQQAEAISGIIKMKALRKLASMVDTASVSPTAGPLRDIPGGGAGDVRTPGRISTWSPNAAEAEPLVVFNTLPYPRSEMVPAKLWDRDWPTDRIVVRDETGKEVPTQFVGTSTYIENKGIEVIFPAVDVPAMGYRSYVVSLADSPVHVEGVHSPSPCVMENEYLRVEIDEPSGAIKHLIDKKSSLDYVPEGTLLGVLELYQEAPHSMTAWDIGEIQSKTVITKGGVPIDETDHRDSREGDSLGMFFALREQQHGPHRMSFRTLHIVNNSRVRLEIALSAGSRSVEINVSTVWQEIGSPETSIPMLRLAFPLNINSPKVMCEIPFGSMERPNDGSEFPALRWVDLSDDKHGAVLVNDCKYGFSVDENTLRATLIRSTYDPDPFPEMGRHDIRFSLIPHEGVCDPADTVRKAEAFNQPMSVVGTDIHSGPLPAKTGFAETLTPNVILASLKKAEDSDAVIVRLYEAAGLETEAKVRLSKIIKPGAAAVEVDLLEQPLPISSARIENDTLIVKLPAHGIATVMIEQE